MRVVFLVPWRTDGGPRAAAWAVCRRRWETLFPDWPIYEGVSPAGPFQRSAAINDAARQAGEWDVAVIIDADILLPVANVKEAVKRVHKHGKVTWAHRRWRGLSKEATERLTGPKGDRFAEGALGPGGIAAPEFTADIDLIIEKTNALSWSCCIAIRRDAWDKLGGFDERFIGWGHEDGAFMSAAGGLIGWDRIEGDVLNLWHPRLPGSGKADRDGRNRYTKQALINGRLGIRYMVALRRDHGLSDRPTPSSQEVIERDIANLMQQDRTEFEAVQTQAERERWTDWWPTLEELRDGATLYRLGPEPEPATITIVLHTGGVEENWPERSGYLRRALASLSENVSGPIIQRVIYSDWGPEHLEELTAIAQGHGFYVAGAGHHGYTGSMQRMWKYLGKRAKGEFVFQAEDDFVYQRPVDLMGLVDVLREDPHLVQIALLRDAFYQDEKETGGILGWPEPAFTRVGTNGTSRLEHRLFFTANPSLFRKTLTDVPWPNGKSSERLFGDTILRDPRARFAFWGDGSEYIRHIGSVRAGTGY